MSEFFLSHSLVSPYVGSTSPFYIVHDSLVPLMVFSFLLSFIIDFLQYSSERKIAAFPYSFSVISIHLLCVQMYMCRNVSSGALLSLQSPTINKTYMYVICATVSGLARVTRQSNEFTGNLTSS